MIPRAVFDYEAAPKESVTCNLCRAKQGFRLEAERDRYGYPQHCVRCSVCDLVFLSPRLTKDAYTEFYRNVYRPLVSAYHGREISPRTMEPEQFLYAVRLERFLRTQVGQPATILDVGGSTGVVARHLKNTFRCLATVLDPAPDEIAHAATDLEVIPGLIEDYDPKGRAWDLVVLCQTVDHLLDITGTLKKLRDCISLGGFLFVDILDYDQTKQTKVDHPYNLTRATMEAYFQLCGYRVVAEADAKDRHVNYLVRVV